MIISLMIVMGSRVVNDFLLSWLPIGLKLPEIILQQNMLVLCKYNFNNNQIVLCRHLPCQSTTQMSPVIRVSSSLKLTKLMKFSAQWRPIRVEARMQLGSF
ncbi:hypothetical protein XELAEV_18027413mg [Xenopus laevis]|uniref:Uncharacterized protein n=1 Tax=Xenopus laevis TaxID=8355 RepID=A0A974HJY4_XENLA|nr:hypothetical protein XELAEV_18027413mg [Xenopus laevis]